MSYAIEVLERASTVTMASGRLFALACASRQRRESTGQIDLFGTDDNPAGPDERVLAELKSYAGELRDELLGLGEDLRITDFQLGLRETRVAVGERSIWEHDFANREFVFEVEVQRTVRDATLLGSSYLYAPALEAIDIAAIMATVRFPFRAAGYGEPIAGRRSDVVFAPPVMASLLENLVYHDLMDHPIGVAGSPVSVWDRPRLLGSVAVNPVDDLGRPTQDALLYGDGNVSAVESRYLIPERSIRRDVSGDIRRHPTNIVLTGPRCETAKLMASVERGIYVYLIVGNHNCRGEFIEGTVFNSFTIEDGELGHALPPFSIRIRKSDILSRIELMGTDTRMLRPFPWWRPAIVHTPTVLCRGLTIQHPYG